MGLQGRDLDQCGQHLRNCLKVQDGSCCFVGLIFGATGTARQVGPKVPIDASRRLSQTKTYCVTLAATGCALATPAASGAQDGFCLRPGLVEVTKLPGKVWGRYVYLRNQTTRPVLNLQTVLFSGARHSERGMQLATFPSAKRF